MELFSVVFYINKPKTEVKALIFLFKTTVNVLHSIIHWVIFLFGDLLIIYNWLKDICKTNYKKI